MSKESERRARLLAEVRRKERNAAAKIRRLNLKGIKISSSVQDPREGLRQIAQMSVRQLQAHARKLDKFTDRNNKYVLGATGTVIPGSKFDEYKKLEARYNSKVKSRTNAVGDVWLPNAGMTVEDRLNHVLPDSIRAAGEINDNPFSKLKNLRPENIKDVDKAIADMRRKLERGYMPKVLKNQKQQAHDMLKVLGNAELSARLDRLSNNQFDLLFNFSTFATEAAKYYALIQAGMTQSDNPAFQGIVENGLEDLNDAFDWAEKLPRTNPKARASRR